MSEAARSNILPIYRPTTEADEDPSTRPVEYVLPLWKRFLYHTGVISMVNSQPKPPGFYVNLSSLSLIVGILVVVAGALWWVKDTSDKNGYERGVQEEQMRQRDREMDKLRLEVKQAKDAALINSDPEPTPTPRRK